MLSSEDEENGHDYKYDKSPSNSSSSSISMEEYMRRLFTACDTDNDGYLDRSDLEEVCKQLGIEENISEIIEQLGGGKTGKISYEDFCHNKAQLLNDMNTGQTSSSESAPELSTDTEYNTNNQRTNNYELKPEKHGRKGQTSGSVTTATKPDQSSSSINLTDFLDSATLSQLKNLQGSPVPSSSREQPKGTDFLEIANRLHLAALTSLKNEIFDLNSRLHHVTAERDGVKTKLIQLNAEKQKMQKDFEDRLQSQMMRVTELQSVIAELTRKLNEATGNKIVEEDEEIEESQCSSDLEAEEGFSNQSEGSRGTSECSCENEDCIHHVVEDGPNQVNFLATTNDIIEPEPAIDVVLEDDNEKKDDENCYDELSRVIGALECTIADRKKIKQTGHEEILDAKVEKAEVENVQLSADKSIIDGKMLEKAIQHSRQELYLLEEQKRALQKEIQQIGVEDYVNRRSAETAAEEEIGGLQKERDKLRGKLRKAEQELEELKAANITIREEREHLRKKTRNLQDALERRSSLNQSPIPPPSPAPSVSSTSRTNSLPRQSHINGYQTPNESRRTSLQTQPSLQSSVTSPFTAFPSKKYSGSPASTLQKQKNVAASSDLGSSIGDEFVPTEFSETLIRCLRSRIPETLLQTLITYNKLDQILNSLHSHYTADATEKTREMELEIERLTSRLSHLKSQNDLLQLCLEESKGNCERLSLLVAKYESKDTALSMALRNTDEIIETYEVMLKLQESEQDMLVASYRHGVQTFTTDTMKSLTSTHSSKSNVSGASSLTSNSHYQLTYGEDLLPDEDEAITTFQNSQSKRRDAESHAKSLLHKLDRKYEISSVGGSILFDDNMDFNSRTSTLSSANSSNIDSLSKEEEMRLKDYVQVLKTERSTVETTVVELESVNDIVEPVDDSNIEIVEKERDRNLDLETAVLLQELQALKEERAELKHRIYMLEKERRALELKLSSREAQEQAYIVHIEHLKSEVKEQIRKRKQILKEERKLRGSMQDDDGQSSTSGTTTPAVTLTESRTSEEDIPADLYDAARREKKLKGRIQELVETLEKLSKNSEIRHQQTAEYISDLKRANGALVSAYEKAKKRHASRLKKFEAQLITMAERHQEQMRILKERISKLEEDKKMSLRNETSL